MRIAGKWHNILDGYDKAQQILNDLDWNVSARPRQNGEWALFAGDQELATFSNRAEMEAFISGMALVVGVLPADVAQQMKNLIR